MKKIIFTIATMFLMASCSAIKSGEVSDRIEQASDSVMVVCGTARQLSTAGVDVPGIEKCEDILPHLSGDEIVAIIAVLNCAGEHDVSEKGFAKCAVDAGWEPVRDRIAELAGK